MVLYYNISKYRLMIRIRTYLVCIGFRNFTRILIRSALLLARLIAQPSHYQNFSLSFSVPFNQDYSRIVTLYTPEVELTGCGFLRTQNTFWTTFNIRSSEMFLLLKLLTFPHCTLPYLIPNWRNASVFSLWEFSLTRKANGDTNIW